MTVWRWVNDGLPPHVASYLILCVVLDVSPKLLLDGDVNVLCKSKNLTLSEICFICDFEPFSFNREMTGTRDRIPKALVQLGKLYDVNDSFAQVFDLNQVRRSAIARLNRIENIISAA